MAVGSYLPHNVKAEIYDFSMDAWTTVQDYPFAAEYVVENDMVYAPATSAYYVIGGNIGNWSTTLLTIAMFKNGAWSEAGQLNTARDVSFYSYCVSKLPVQF